MQSDLESLVAQLAETGMRLPLALGVLEKHYIHRVLERTHGNRSRAARLLGIHRNTLSRKIEAYQLKNV